MSQKIDLFYLSIGERKKTSFGENLTEKAELGGKKSISVKIDTIYHRDSFVVLVLVGCATTPWGLKLRN